MNKLQKLKAEIERLYSISLDRANITNNSYWEGKADAYRNVLISFEEPIKVTIGEPKEAEGVLGEMIKDFNPQEDLGISSEKYAEIVNECVHGKEEPVSEDLEQAAVEAFKHIVDSDKNNFYEIFKAGANWQRDRDFIEMPEALRKEYERGSKDMIDKIKEILNMEEIL